MRSTASHCHQQTLTCAHKSRVRDHCDATVLDAVVWLDYAFELPELAICHSYLFSNLCGRRHTLTIRLLTLCYSAFLLRRYFEIKQKTMDIVRRANGSGDCTKDTCPASASICKSLQLRAQWASLYTADLQQKMDMHRALRSM